MPHRIRLRLLLFVLPLALACSASGPTEISYEPTSPGIQAGYVAVTATSSGLMVVNQTAKPVYYFAVERNAAKVVDWAPCSTLLAQCVGIAQGETKTIPWANVVGYKADATEYLFYWYHVTTVAGTSQATGMQSIVVKR